jgi:hypothetical protein
MRLFFVADTQKAALQRDQKKKHTISKKYLLYFSDHVMLDQAPINKRKTS